MRCTRAQTYGRVTKTTLGDGLKQGRLANVGKTDDTTLQVVSRTTEEDLLLYNLFLGRHFSSLGVGTSGDIDCGATRHAVWEKRRASCDRSKGVE